MDLHQILEQWGLHQKEAKVYLAVLELGQSKAHEISKKAHLLRETTYFVLNSLINQGLVSTVIKSGVKYFEAAHPHKLLSILQEKQALIEDQMLQLEGLYQMQSKKPLVEFYEGKEGLKTILSDIIKTKEPLWAYANYNISKLLEYEFPRFVKERLKQNISARIIQEKHVSLQRSAEQNKEEMREIRFSKVVFKSNVFIYGTKVALINVTREQPMGVLIDNKTIADTQRQVFELLWEQCAT